MALSGLDPDLLGQLNRSSASAVQIYLLQRVIRSVEPNSLLSQNTSVTAGMAAELPRAQAALWSHGSILQPQRSLLDSLCKAAEVSVARAEGFRPNDRLLQDLRLSLDRVSNMVTGVADAARRRANAITLAQELEGLIQGIPNLIREMFSAAWLLIEVGDDWSLLDHVSNEMACLVASRDRDPEPLESQLIAVIRHESLDVQKIINVLLPNPMRYRVVCIVRGVRELAGLNDLESTARQQSSSAPEALRRGMAVVHLTRFLAKISRETPYCVVSVDVKAVDSASAARLGRRRVTELLDQYVAGGRLIRLSLDPSTLVAQGMRAREWEPPRPSVQRAYPLLNFWPEGLREGLRMSHIARVTDSPLTAAALSWVALEASVIEGSNSQNLAKALSLQAFRQQLVEAHRMIYQSIRASTQIHQSEVNYSSVLVRKDLAALERIPEHLQSRREEAKKQLVTAEARFSVATVRYAEFTASSERIISALNEYVNVNSYKYLLNLNRWVDVLLPARPSDSVECNAARSALTSILPYLTPLVAGQIVGWQRRLSTQDLCVEWISSMQLRMESFLSALYSARNLALHTGAFSTAGDAVLGRGGVMLVDFAIEFLGNWYLNADQIQSGMAPFEIVNTLAHRQNHIVEMLSTRPWRVYALDLAHLTGPTWSDTWQERPDPVQISHPPTN